jgi:hypothetical protein
MAEEMKNWKKWGGMCGGGTGGAVYGLGFLGALVYFLQQATSLTAGIIGVGKAIVWPALLIYRVLGFFNF